MRNILRAVLFVVPYPQAAIYHAILGGALTCLYAVLFLNYRGDGHWPAWGCVVGVVVSFLLWEFWLKGPPTNTNSGTGAGGALKDPNSTNRPY